MADIRELARNHLLPHFTAADAWRDEGLPVLVRGEGCHVYDDAGRRHLDGLAGLFCVNMGHGRSDIVAAAAKQMETLAYAPNWASAHPPVVEAASLIAGKAPGDLDVVFFVNSGSEAVESAIKFVRQYHRSNGEPGRTKIIARDMAYHGTTMGALSVTGIPKYREPFGPLLTGVRHVPNTLGRTTEECVAEIERVVAEEGAQTIAAVFAEPVQNSRGALVPPDGYWRELRALCDRHGILLVADEVICGFGRLGAWFGSALFDVVPDVITFAKGATSGYAPLGGMIVRTPLAESMDTFTHGATWGGHPVATAVAVANLTALRDEDIVGNVARLGPRLRRGLEGIGSRVVKEVRGTGYFYAIELMADRETGAEFTQEQATRVLRQVIPSAMRETGLITRADDRGATMLMISPPLVADEAVIDELVGHVEHVVTRVEKTING